MKTTRELQIAIGQRCSLRTERLSVDCTVKDVRPAWGRIDVLVRPVAGEGEQWVSIDRLIVHRDLAVTV